MKGRNMVDLGREVTLEFIRVTEAAALKASRWMGRGDKNAADQAAVDADERRTVQIRRLELSSDRTHRSGKYRK